MSAGALAQRGAQAPRLDRKVLLGVVAGGLVGLLVVAAVAVKLLAPAPASSQCVGALCPPQPGPPGLISLTPWRSALGFQVEYDPSDWSVTGQDGQDLKLQSQHGDLFVWIQGFSASDGSIQQLIGRHLSGLEGSVIGLSTDGVRQDRILGPAIGFVDGVGATYQGTVRNASGPGGQEFVYVVAATDGKVTAVISAATTVQDYRDRNQLLSSADNVLNYFKFPEQLG